MRRRPNDAPATFTRSTTAATKSGNLLTGVGVASSASSPCSARLVQLAIVAGVTWKRLAVSWAVQPPAARSARMSNRSSGV